MKLTKEQQDLIIAEEKLRAKLRGDGKFDKANKFLGNVFTIFLILGVIVGLIIFLFGSVIVI